MVVKGWPMRGSAPPTSLALPFFNSMTSSVFASLLTARMSCSFPGAVWLQLATKKSSVPAEAANRQDSRPAPLS